MIEELLGAYGFLGVLHFIWCRKRLLHRTKQRKNSSKHAETMEMEERTVEVEECEKATVEAERQWMKTSWRRLGQPPSVLEDFLEKKTRKET